LNRRLFITVHLYLSSFFAALVLLVAMTGGLYLAGFKGSMAETTVATLSGQDYTLPEEATKADVERLLAAAGVEDFPFEYVRQSGARAYTRPTSEAHYLIEARGRGDIRVVRREPDLQARLMELHKGHGPGHFKTLQKVFALGLLFVILSGLWLGLSAPRLRRNPALSFGAGLGVFLLVLLV
jgi:hypothetical protein